MSKEYGRVTFQKNNVNKKHSIYYTIFNVPPRDCLRQKVTTRPVVDGYKPPSPNICVNRFKEPKAEVSKLNYKSHICTCTQNRRLPLLSLPTTSGAIKEKECLRTTKEKGQLKDMGIIIFKESLKKALVLLLHSRKRIYVHINQGSGLNIHVGKNGQLLY